MFFRPHFPPTIKLNQHYIWLTALITKVVSLELASTAAGRYAHYSLLLWLANYSLDWTTFDRKAGVRLSIILWQ